ncbi:MAG: hypothetical protein PHI12_11855 [Dehalococcoidales bacterium]|jgi:hypothetical protein|nr:hypothetical protein [Dehalococcoidales bacterium]
MSNEFNLEATLDRPEERKAFIAKIRAMLPAPMRCVREAETEAERGFLHMSRTGLHIFDAPKHQVDYAPDHHILFTVKAYYIDYTAILARALAPLLPEIPMRDLCFKLALLFPNGPAGWATKKIRCPNCGHTITRVPADVGEQDLLLVACENMNSYQFYGSEAAEGQEPHYGDLQHNPHGPIVFEYQPSGWL